MGLTIKERTRFTNYFTILYINERNLMDEVFQNANIHNYFHMVEKKIINKKPKKEKRGDSR